MGSVRLRIGHVRLAGMAERVQVREIDDDERQRLLRIVGRGTGSVVTWRRVQMILLSALGMPPGKIAKSRPSEHGLPFSTWSLSNLADFLVAGGWSTTSPTRACGSCSVTRASHFKP